MTYFVLEFQCDLRLCFFFRILFDNSEQCLNCYHRLGLCISPISRLEDLFAFAFHAWCLDSKQSNSVQEGEFTSFCQRGWYETDSLEIFGKSSEFKFSTIIGLWVFPVGYYVQKDPWRKKKLESWVLVPWWWLKNIPDIPDYYW